jgi:hypothetical protein
MPPRLPFLSTPSDARTATLQGLLIATIVIGALYFAREVLLPLTLAILLSFVLTPPLLVLRRFKVPRVLAVAIVVVTAFAIIGGLGWLVSREATDLAVGEDPVAPRRHQRVEGAQEGRRCTDRPSGRARPARARC